MFTQAFILILGLILLYIGSSLLVEGAASTAIMFAVRPAIVGLTIVSLATSAPELLVSLVAALKGSGQISIGNILGSNVINIALVLGISAVIKPVVIKQQIIKIEIPYMIFTSLIFWLLCMDSHIGRLDGYILFFLLFVFLVYGVTTAKDKDNKTMMGKLSFPALLKNIFFIVVGIVMLSYGANFVVQEAITIAVKIGLSQTFIGISVVALGTSLPELATSAVAAARGESDISVGNVVGSNLFNICLVMGVVGIFNPMTIDKNLHNFQFPFMLFICFALGLVAYLNQGIGKKTGYAFISLFIVYIIISYLK
ncbi:MAG: calcium/sodium antiporter [Proteobacteria bacterium]|nr:calcium/sodium antiporter [Pseudomonadota bacterium]MBU1582555.1 calcium/sodium antiporter [Pseudomonadota bacterium]MBU2630963.1 calcium/sodium antiporter [Pseudomonadota bacterium]